MFQKINALQKNQKGFTLVELIVVLVILAILAAFTIPAMLGFVGDARAKASISIAREIYVAAQSSATEIATGMKLEDKAQSGINRPGNETAADYIKAKIVSLLGNDISDAKKNGLKVLIYDEPETQQPAPAKDEPHVLIKTDGKIYSVSYVDDFRNLIIIKDGETTITKAEK